MTTTPLPPAAAPMVDPVAVHLAVINTKLDTLIDNGSDHEVRLRSLESFKWLLVGAATAAGGSAGAIAAQLLK